MWWRALATRRLDLYPFAAECPFCKVTRGVTCSRSQVRTGEPIEVYAIACDYSWTLTSEESRKLRENASVAATLR